ncbi:MAG: signal recognition particle protein Srp19, partial [Candidatus Micrarchaeota archaeon]
GRSAFDEELASELRTLRETFKPDEAFLVLSADVGQVAERQAAEFNASVPLTGVIVTKMDGSGKGGGALSAVAASGCKVAFIGTGEKPEAFEAFDAKKFVARLCGFPDLQGLLEKVKETTGEEQLQKAIEDGKLDYNAFMAQMKAMKKMGPLKGILQMMGAYDLPEELVGKSEERMKSFEAAVNSMTPAERANPDLMHNAKRQARVAKGAGLQEKDVRELVTNFERASKMMKGLRGNRSLMKKLGGMMPGMR